MKIGHLCKAMLLDLTILRHSSVDIKHFSVQKNLTCPTKYIKMCWSTLVGIARYT